MKLKLTDTIKKEDKTIEVYEIGRYTVRVVAYESGFRSIDVRSGRDDYLPEIYCRDDIEGRVIGFDVQTTSYGAISPDEIRKVIAGLEEAAKVAEFLDMEFVEKEN